MHIQGGRERGMVPSAPLDCQGPGPVAGTPKYFRILYNIKPKIISRKKICNTRSGTLILKILPHTPAGCIL